MRRFSELFHLDGSTTIIDVGGTKHNWSLIEQAPNVLMVNLEGVAWEEGRLKMVEGDGRCLEYPDNSFAIAYSNSVIEHVGDFKDQLAFANEIRRVAPRYYVQTPNKWFFIETHLIAPFIHWLPEKLTRKLLPFCSAWFWATRPNKEEVDLTLKSIRLLDRKEMSRLFPDAEILLEEQLFGLAKSIIAVRR